MKLTGYTRDSDSTLKKQMKRFMSNRGTSATIFHCGNPLCDVDARRCSQRGKLQKGHCYDAYASMMKAGPCRKVEVEYTVNITVTDVPTGGGK